MKSKPVLIKFVLAFGTIIILSASFIWGPFLEPLKPDWKKAQEEWVNGVEKLLAESGTKPRNIQGQFFYVKKAELELEIAEKAKDSSLKIIYREEAKNHLEQAFLIAKENRIGEYGFFGTRISPKLAALLPDAKFFQSRPQTLIEF